MPQRTEQLPLTPEVFPSWQSVLSRLSSATPVLMRQHGARAAEVVALRNSGLLRPLIGDVHVSATAPDEVAVRVSALALLLPPPRSAADVVVGFEAARWVLVGGPAPDHLDVYAIPGRSRKRFRGCRVHEAPLAPGMVTVSGGLTAGSSVAVTVPSRTAVDLARSRPLSQALAEWDRLTDCGLTAAAVDAMVARMSRSRGVPRARAAMRQWPGCRSVGPVSGHPIGVEHTLDLAHH